MAAKQKTGKTCKQSGDYQCAEHSLQIIPIAKGEKFPPCAGPGRKAHGATWVLIEKR